MTYRVLRSAPPNVHVVIFFTGISITRSIFRPAPRGQYIRHSIGSSTDSPQRPPRSRPASLVRSSERMLHSRSHLSQRRSHRPDHIDRRVPKIEPATIGTPGQGVGDAHVAAVHGHTRIRIDPIQNAILPASVTRRSVRVHVVAHRAHPQRAAWISARVIETDGRPSLQVVRWVRGKDPTRAPTKSRRSRAPPPARHRDRSASMR